jgi:hypothetical protein
MRKMVITLLALGVFAASTAFAANAVRFSQVYGGGGSGTGTYAPDYIELFNNSGAAVDMSGWMVQYGSATGNFASNTFTIATLPAGAIIQPCGYYLMQVGSSAVGPPALPVTPDFVNTPGPNMSATAGKVALLPAGTATNQLCGVIAPLAIDLFGWGTTATCFEVQAAPAPSNVIIAVRKLGGMQDTDNNFNDFVNTSAPLVTMHNAAGGFRNTECLAVPAAKNSWGQIKTMYR